MASTTLKPSAVAAAVHMESALEHLQDIHALTLPDNIKRSTLQAQKVVLSILGDIRKWGGIKPEQPAIFLPAFPVRDRRHL